MAPAGAALGAGPLAGAVRELLTPYGDALRAALREHDAAAAPAASRAVPTHGEPHPGNVVVTGAGPVLVDWDTARLAEPERDLWLVAGRTLLDVPGLYRELHRPVRGPRAAAVAGGAVGAGRRRGLRARARLGTGRGRRHGVAARALRGTLEELAGG